MIIHSNALFWVWGVHPAEGATWGGVRPVSVNDKGLSANGVPEIRKSQGGGGAFQPTFRTPHPALQKGSHDRGPYRPAKGGGGGVASPKMLLAFGVNRRLATHEDPPAGSGGTPNIYKSKWSHDALISLR